MAAIETTPVTIIGGYLGSGKTTLVNHLLRNAAGKRLAILVNEFGELPIDADLIEAQDDDIISLSGGCVCCSYGNDLIMAMLDLTKMQPMPDHIVLESSGVALPGAIAKSLSLLQGYSVDGIVVLADAETVRERLVDKYMADTVQRQLADADIVLLNKTDLIDEIELILARDCVRAASQGAAIVETQQAVAPISVVLQSHPANVGGSVSDSHDTSVFESFKLDADEAVDVQEFAKSIITDNASIVRAKGFVRDLHGNYQTLQIVGKRIAISAADSHVEAGVVVIRLKTEVG